MKEVENLDKEQSLLFKIKNIIYGKERPDLFTRTLFYLGVLCWTIFLFWAIAGMLSSFFIDEIDHADKARAMFNKIGFQYDIHDFLWSFKNNVITQLIALVIVKFGLILIWREKNFGTILYLIGYSVFIFSIPIFLGFTYMWKEISIFEKVLYAIATTPFVILFLYNIRKKAKKKGKAQRQLQKEVDKQLTKRKEDLKS